LALIDEVKDLCDRLAPHGWAELLLKHGLDITRADLEKALTEELTIKRTGPGFEDFSKEGKKAIEPGDPAMSLLFHALASPNVVTKGDEDETPLSAFPTLEDIDTIENYVYAQKFAKLSDLKKDFTNLSVVVFATEYRSWNDTTHKKHADMCFSRTGVSRVGTALPKYLPETRGFTPLVDENNKHAIRVLPTRYSAYLAVKMDGDEGAFRPMRFWSDSLLAEINDFFKNSGNIPSETDDNKSFWIPIHKLFNGGECLTDVTFDITLKSFHVNEKIRKIHLTLSDRTDKLKSESETRNYPYKFTEDIAEFSNKPELKFGHGVLEPVVHPHLVEKAEDSSGLVSFRLPKNNRRDLRFSSSLRIEQSGPEYVHVRSKVLSNTNTQNLNEKHNGENRNIQKIVEDGDYEALHYVDFSADGFITAEITGDAEITNLKKISAYSLVTAPDFIPFCNQRELMEWWHNLKSATLKRNLWGRPPFVLSDSRIRPNLNLGTNVFDNDDVTCTSIVSLPFKRKNTTSKTESTINRHSSLPDNAAGVFAPGWDVGTDIITIPDTSRDVLATVGYRLGSPFSEDAKLCAALSTFWPAVAPDVSRTFGPTFFNQPNICPLSDAEIGIDGGIPWDGVKGPVNVGNKVEYTLFEYADYTLNALNDKFSLYELSKMDFAEYTKRIIAMAKVKRYSELPNIYSVISFKQSSDTIDEFNDAARNFSTSMNSPYRFRICTYSARTDDHDKSTFTIKNNFTIFADGDMSNVQDDKIKSEIWVKKGRNGNWTSGSWTSEPITL